MSAVERALAGANEVAGQVSATPSWKRSQWLAAVASEIENHLDELAELIVAEGVKTIREAENEVGRAAATFRIAAQAVGQNAGSVVSLDRSPNGADRLGICLRRPMGVVLGITPFNDPLNLVAHKVAPAIAAGNAIIVKPHEKTPEIAHRLARLCLASGMPEGAVTVIECDHTDTLALIRDYRVGMVSFTGGKSGGTAVATAAAGKPLSLELGGVASTIVMADADVDRAVPLIVSGMIAAAGQNCLHVQRVLVAEPIYDKVLSMLKEGIRAVRLGARHDRRVDMGRLIDAEAIERCNAWVREAVEMGAIIETGGKAFGETYEPTILSHVHSACRVVNEEVFGPVTAIEPFSSLDDAISAASRSGASLAVGIFTRSLDVPNRLTALPVGQIVVNDSSDFRVDHMPFGGPGAAGLGREGIDDAMLAMSEKILICSDIR